MADSLHKATAGIGKLITDVEGLFKEVSQVRNLLLTLGWTPPQGLDDIGLAGIDFSALYAKLDQLLSSTTAEKEDPALMAQRVGELAIALADFVASVSQLAEGLPSQLPGFAAFIAETDIVTEFPKRFFSFWLSTYISGYSLPLFSLLRLLNIIEYRQFDADPAKFQAFHVRPVIHYDGFFSLLANPASHFREAYGWGTGDFNSLDLLYRFSALMESIGITSSMRRMRPEMHSILTGLPIPADAKDSLQLQLTFYEQLSEIAGMKAGLSLFGVDATSAGGMDAGIGFMPVLRGAVNGELPLYFFDDTVFLYSADAELLKRMALILRPGSGLSVTKAQSLPDIAEGRVTIGYRNGSSDKPARTLLSFPGGFSLQYQAIAFRAGLDQSGDKPAAMFAELELTGLRAGISLNQADGFLQSATQQKNIEGNFGLTIGWDSYSGIYFNGSSALEISIPAHAQLGPFTLGYFHTGIIPSRESLRLDLMVTGTVKAGPLVITVNKMGASLLAGFDGGNLGLFDLTPSFHPPTGIGLAIDSGGFQGGGILNFDDVKKEYFGAMELEYRELFSLKAFGIINTRMPDGSDGFSLLIIITAEFTPVQLGFGFTLMGVGGLLGLNRTVRLDVLKEGIRTNAIKSILFPEDIVANINRIVSDVQSVFPVQQDHFIVCPMGKLGWGTPAIITLELGLLVEIPVAGFAILGVLKAILPEEESALLKLQINFIGVADFDKRSFSLDGTLYESRLLVYTLTGDMAFRLSYGDHPVFVMSVGGFHPAFREAPADLLHMERLSISLFNSDSAWIKVDTYFAVTSNTAQFGARAELFAGNAGGFNIYGFLGYDVLFQFDPFHFVADFSAGFALRRRTSVIMGVTASGELSGPAPWDAHGKASVSFFFFSVSVSFHKTWGDSIAEPEPAVADLTDMLRKAIADDRNWKADIPANNKLYVSIKEIVSDKTVVHPFGLLTFSERILPLKIDLEKFGNKQPKDEKNFSISTSAEKFNSEEVREPFAPASFFNLDDADKLKRPSYETMLSGFRVTGSKELVLPIPVARPVDYELSYLGVKRTKLKRFGAYRYDKLSMKAGSKGGSAASSKLSVTNSRISANAPERVPVSEERFAIATTSDMTLYRKNLVAGSYTEALERYSQLIATDPSLAEQLQIVADYELNVN